MNYREKITEKLAHTKEYIRYFLIWILLGTLMGVISGGIGAAFAHTLEAVTALRGKFPHLLFLLPVAGLTILLVYRACRIHKAGTNAVFETVRDERTVPILLAPAVFLGTALTHLCGGSAGREGAALQIGGSIAALLGKIFKLEKKRLHILTMCGMSALFSAVFGTPVGACVFAVEVASVGRLYTAAMFPCMVSSTVSYGVACLLGVHPEKYSVGVIPAFGFEVFAKAAIIGVAAAVVGILFCLTMHGTQELFRKTIKNEYLRVAAGGAIIIGLSLLVGEDTYNGSGVHIIEGIFEGSAVIPVAFLFKIVFTAITMGSGYKGGEIVPTLFIGATLGATAAGLLGLAAPFGAAIGMTAMFSAVTNCPLTAVFLACELFGAEGVVFYTAAILTSYLLSGNFSLYEGQKVVYSRLDDKKI